MSGKPFNMVNPADYRYWELLNQAVQEEPSESLDQVRLGFWASIGIEKGKPFAPDARMKAILTEAAAVGDATARAISFHMPASEDYYYKDAYWQLPFIGGYKFQSQPGVLNLDGYIFYYFMATGVTPAMEEKMVGLGSQYAWTARDAQGDALDGGKSYRLRLPAERAGQGLLVGDPLQQPDPLDDPDRPALPQRQQPDEGAAQATPTARSTSSSGRSRPAGKESNWVQTVPGHRLEHHPAPLRPARALVRQDLAARRHRAGLRTTTPRA